MAKAKPKVERVLLYRTPSGWRITVQEDGQGGIACGMLPETPADASFDEAAREFEAQLQTHWAVDGALKWEQTKPDWWAAEVSETP